MALPADTVLPTKLREPVMGSDPEGHQEVELTEFPDTCQSKCRMRNSSHVRSSYVTAFSDNCQIVVYNRLVEKVKSPSFAL